jgi:hypothetical protein
MKSWKDYIEQKFVPKEDFDFKQDDKEIEYAGQKLISSKITVTHRKTQTNFEFQNAYGDWECLDWLIMRNPKTKCCPKASIYYDDRLDDVGVKIRLEEFMYIAFNGWTVREYYLSGKYNRAFYYSNLGGKGNWDYAKFKVWDIFRIIDLLLYLRIIGEEKLIVIEPINAS